MTKNYLLPFCFLFLVFGYWESQAQSTNPAPYCYPSANGMTSGTCTGNYGFNLQSVKLNTLSQTGGCYGSGVNDVYRYWSASTSLNAGASYPVTIVTPQSIYNYNVSAGVWIDLNQNNKFDSTELLAATLKGNNVNGGLYHYLTISIPCSATAGTTRLRVQARGLAKIKGTDSCGVSNGYGETWDFDVTIVQPNSVSADFSMPSQAFVKTVVKLINSNQSNIYKEHAWDVNNDATWEQKGLHPNYSTKITTWTTTGTKCVKLRSTNCFGSDSVVKCLSIVNPTAKPAVGFTKVTPCEKVVEIYNQINLIDTSGQGPYTWTWNVYDSVTFKNDPFDPISDLSSGWLSYDNGTNQNSQNPFITFYREGLYSVELIATNGVGTSKMTKKSYIMVINPTTYHLGFGSYGPQNDNRVLSDYGFIVDDGGPNTNYGNRQGKATKSFLIINPPAALPITMKFQQLRLKDTKDSIKIYDDDKMDNSKLITVLTSANNGTYPSYTSTANKMYFYFTSDSSGTDSGYQVQYTNTGMYKFSKYQDISIGHNLLFVNGNSVFYNENQNEFGFNYTKEWSVNDTVQTAYNDQDTLKYKFRYTGNQKVCLEMKTCDTSFKSCRNLVFESGLMGLVYKDSNSNCAFSSGDKRMPNIHMKLFDSTLNSWSHYYTNSLGEYNFNKGNGTYKVAIDASGMPFRTICSTPGVDSFFRLSSVTPYRAINFDIGCKTGHDIGTQSIWTSGIVFPGRRHDLRVSAGDLNKWFGLNCNSGLSGSVVIMVTGKISYVSPSYGTLTPSSVSGNIFTYNISDFSQINNNSDFGLVFKTDTSAKGGDTISVRVRVTPVSGDNDTTNNDLRYRYRVLNSYDPNMKEVYPDDLTDGFKDWLTYTIHFQNTGTAPAFDIRLADTLSALLDPETFQLLNYSHPVTTTLSERILSFKFKDIMLPDSNSDEKGSHGFVQFRIKPKAALKKGVKLENKAYIYFDYNDPVITNTATNDVLPKGVLIPDPAFAAWLTVNYPSCMYKGNLMDSACSDIKNATSVDVSGNTIANLFGIQFFKSLQVLNCSGNDLSSFPELPATLTQLSCSGNKFTTLPALPSSLADLDCSDNAITTLGSLPVPLQSLKCGSNQLNSLPLLPVSLTVLECSNNKISCFDKFPDGLSVLGIAGNTNKCLPNYVSAMDANTLKMPLCIKGDVVNNPDDCPTTLPLLVKIPDVDFAAWLNAAYAGCLYNGNWMDTSCNDIKIATSVNVASKNIEDLFGIQFFTSLKTLNCSGNLLTGLPALPATMTYLNCSGNNMKGLPALPGTMEMLLCGDNDLVALPVLPGGLQMLSCGANQLPELPALPAGLSQLVCDNNDIVCFKKFSDNISTINISDNKNKCLPNYIDAMDAATKMTPLCTIGDGVNNPDNCPGSPQISIQKVADQNNIYIYPNPGSGVFYILLPENLKNTVFTAEVYNILGEKVAVFEIGNGDAHVDLTGRSRGVYLLKLMGPDFLITRSLVKE